MRFNELFCVLAALLILTSCSSEAEPEKHDTPQEVALAAYNHLIKGEYEKYIATVHSADSIPDKYRKSLIMAIKQFITKEKEENDGITGVSVADEKTDTKDTYSLVMLTLSYGNGMSEEVAVPVVKANGVWRLR